MKRFLVVLALVLLLPVVGDGQSINYWPSTTGNVRIAGSSPSINYYPSSVAASSLVTGLVSYWTLDEASGVRYDSYGSNDLTDNNTVGSDAGVNGTAASFVAANSESLSRAGVSATPDMTVAFWLRAPSMVNDKDILGLFSSWPSNGAFHFRSSPTIMSLLVASGAGYAQADCGVGVTVNDGNWHLFIGTFSSSDNTGRIYYDGDNLGPAEAALGASISTASHTFIIGGGLLGNATQEIDEVAFWSRVLTSDERTELWNSGSGKFYNGSTFE